MKFNTNYKTISKIANSNRLERPAIITKTGLIVYAQDIEAIETMLASDVIKLQSCTKMKLA